MRRRPFKGLLVGLGTMGTHHLRVLRALPGVRLCGAVDPREDRRNAAAAVAPDVPVLPTLEQGLAVARPDFVCLAAPACTLPGLAHEALDAGAAILVEKPMAPTEEEAVGMVREADARGVLFSVGHVEWFNPAVMALRERLDRGFGGRIYQIHARRLSPFPLRESPSGVALDLATHDLDIIRRLTGSEVARVHAETARRAGSRSDDLLSASIRLDSGTAGVVEANWLTPAKVRELSVTAEEGMFTVDYLTQDLSFFENPRANIEWDALAVVRGTGEGNMTRYALERREPLRVEWEAFLSALGDDREPPVSGWDGVAALSIACAAQRSGELHAPQVPSYRSLALPRY
jgi:UDP-N-acetylglucosamine 3-dehydrogenase